MADCFCSKDSWDFGQPFGGVNQQWLDHGDSWCLDCPPCGAFLSHYLWFCGKRIFIIFGKIAVLFSTCKYWVRLRFAMKVLKSRWIQSGDLSVWRISVEVWYLVSRMWGSGKPLVPGSCRREFGQFALALRLVFFVKLVWSFILPERYKRNTFIVCVSSNAGMMKLKSSKFC